MGGRPQKREKASGRKEWELGSVFHVPRSTFHVKRIHVGILSRLDAFRVYVGTGLRWDVVLGYVGTGLRCLRVYVVYG